MTLRRTGPTTMILDPSRMPSSRIKTRADTGEAVIGLSERAGLWSRTAKFPLDHRHFTAHDHPDPLERSPEKSNSSKARQQYIRPRFKNDDLPVRLLAERPDMVSQAQAENDDRRG
ncbi:MAG: hypothetical protein MZU91_04795 [Desulfosudis oleivorans]|nr:hypothetical protein [Desulfosudis oleivorans]